MLAAIAEDYSMRAVRGSSGRRGVAGFMDMMQELKAGYSMCITPDGPKGPLYRCHPGAVKLASVSGMPIVPVTISIPCCWRIKSAWDHFVIPVPFSSVHLRWGKKIHVPAGLSPEQLELFCRKLENALSAGAPDFEPF